MTAAAVTRDYDALLDKAYRDTKLGPHVADFLAWLKVAQRAETTRDQYERDLARGCLMYPSLAPREWSSKNMLHVLQAFPAASQKRAASPWRTFWKWAVQWQLVDANPMDRLPDIPRLPRKVIEVFSEMEEELLIAQPELRDRALMMILLDTGIRKAEARNLRAENVDLDGQRLKIREGAKGGKHRIVPIAGRLVSTVAELLITEGIDAADHLWYTRLSNQHGTRLLRSRPTGEGTFHRWWVERVKYAGVEYRKPHTTRHTFATKWIRDGGGIVELSKMLGHASVKTTIDEYTHLVTDDIAAELERILELRATR